MVLFISGWALFCIATAVLLLAALAMQYFGGFFVTRDVLVRNFTILDLELASTEREIDNTLHGVTLLNPADSGIVLRSLKNHLYADFIFMPGAYGAVFIACMKVAWKMPWPGDVFFSALAWLQIIAFLCDVTENIYLLRKISRVHEPYRPPFITFHTYQLLEVFKWGLSMLAAVCALSAFLYFWISGLYMGQSLGYLALLTIELIIFAVLMKVVKTKGKKWRLSVPNS